MKKVFVFIAFICFWVGFAQPNHVNWKTSIQSVSDNQYELIYDDFGNLNKQIEYSEEQKRKTIYYFDLNGVVKIIEEYVNNKLVSRCEYIISEK